jgi:outer membrane protein OmpA-like peptidoglycan-associated protein
MRLDLRRFPRALAGLGLALTLALGAIRPAAAQDLDFGYVPAPGPGEDPALLVTPARAVKSLHVEIEAGGKTYTFDQSNLAAGKQLRLSWKRDTSVTEAEAFVRAIFPDGFVDELTIPIEYSYAGQLSVDLSRASADLKAHTLTVRVAAPVQRAEITAYGARKATLDQREVVVEGGPGEITLPWVGDASTVVLLDVKLHNEGAWAGFTYSPWFLDIPHEDVLFDSDSAEIPSSETRKLQATLQDLKEVLEKYGDVVPVKLYIAGCTDTVGDGGHNQELSLKRARAIAKWLRSSGYDKPIYYHGFGERLLAVSTGDGVDEPRNRRVLYMVGANPPPPSTGIPSVGWTAL